VAVSVLAASVGALVTAASLTTGMGGCAGPGPQGPGGPDPVCVRLVWTLAERMGLATAVLTAVLILTFVGLARTASASRTLEARRAPLR
jgi:hypothetical protein